MGRVALESPTSGAVSIRDGVLHPLSKAKRASNPLVQDRRFLRMQ
jgi:hypothetical protein